MPLRPNGGYQGLRFNSPLQRGVSLAGMPFSGFCDASNDPQVFQLRLLNSRPLPSLLQSRCCSVVIRVTLHVYRLYYNFDSHPVSVFPFCSHGLAC